MKGSAARGLVTANPAMLAAGSYRSSRSKTRQETTALRDHLGVARDVIVADRHGEVIEGCKRVAVFGLHAAQIARKD
jgi:hypothetical protein